MRYVKVIPGEITVTPCPFCGTGKKIGVTFADFVRGMIGTHPKMAQGLENIRSGFKMLESVVKADDIWMVEDDDYKNLLSCFTPDQRTGGGQLNPVLVFDCKPYVEAIDEATKEDPRKNPDPPEQE